MEPAKAVIFTIRYSVLLRKSTFVRIGRDVPFEQYRTRLFEPQRLDLHHRLFSTFTLPSLARAMSDATEASVGVYIMVSTELPEAHRKIFDASLVPYPWAKVVAVGPDDRMPHRQCVLDFLQSMNSDAVAYAHCRLDDDDMVSNDFANQLSAYLKREYAGFCVSFGTGFAAAYNENQQRISRLFEYYLPKISAGFALVGYYDSGLCNGLDDIADVHRVGSHSYADKRVPVILDSRRPSFLRTIHNQQDTLAMDSKRDGKTADREIVAGLFAVDAGDLPTPSQSDAARDEMNRLERESRNRLRAEQRRARRATAPDAATPNVRKKTKGPD